MITLKNATLKVKVNPFGAELSSVEYRGEERMWQGDPAIWSGRAPVLFPVAGSFKNNEYTFEGKTYTMPQHGFARRRPFTVAEEQKDLARLVLDSKEDNYPFDYRLAVEFKLPDATPRLVIGYTVENTGDKDMYFTLGAHEAYACPEGIEGTELVFSDDDSLERSILDGAQITHETETYRLTDNTLSLSSDMFENNTLVFGSLKSRQVTMKSMLNPGTVTVEFEDYPCLLIWQKRGAPYLCIEPWTNTPEYVDHDGELTHKPGIQCLKPGESRRYKHVVIFG